MSDGAARPAAAWNYHAVVSVTRAGQDVAGLSVHLHGLGGIVQRRIKKDLIPP